jgi:hypothetical protein
VLFTVDDPVYDDAALWDLPDCAMALLTRAGDWSAHNRKGGFVPATMLARFTSDPKAALRALLDRKIWKRVKDGCQFSNWGRWLRPAQARPGAGPQAPAAPRPEPRRQPSTPAAVRQFLTRDPALKAAILVRDRDACRWCAVAVRWGAGRAADSACWDLVIPEDGVSLANVVTACTRCRKARAAGQALALLPGPGKRDTACHASPGETPGQKRDGEFSTSVTTIDRDRSNLSVPVTSSSPASSAAHEGEKRDKRDSPKRDAAREPKRGTPGFSLQVRDAFAARTGWRITDDAAAAIAADVLGRRKIGHPLAYVLTAVQMEADPLGRWLPQFAAAVQAPPPQPPGPQAGWCGHCDPVDRRVEDAQGRIVGPCPACGPGTAFLQEAS